MPTERTVPATAETTLPLAATEHGGTSGPDALAALRTVGENEYVVERELARGGMGRVLLAWDQRHKRPVAMKTLLASGEVSTRRFLREAAWRQVGVQPEPLRVQRRRRDVDPRPSRTIAGTGRVALGDGSGDAAAFAVPLGLSLAPDGSLWVADSGNGAVRRIVP
jgi:hypothetical protein